MDSCIFCQIVSGKLAAKIMYQDKDIVVFTDVNPVAHYHLLIIPTQHIATLDEVSSEQQNLLGKMHVQSAQIARELSVAQDGYRTVVNCNKNGGQEVYHLHMHFLAGRKFAWPPG